MEPYRCVKDARHAVGKVRTEHQAVHSVTGERPGGFALLWPVDP